MSIQANAIVTVIIDGQSFDKWDVKSGGQTTADITRHRPGGEVQEELHGGLPTTESVTLNRAYDRARDHALLEVLRSKVGSGTVTVSYQPTDGNKIPTADPAIKRTGMLAGAPALGPDFDNNSSDVALIEITVDLA